MILPVAFVTLVLALVAANLPLPGDCAAIVANARPCNFEEWNSAQSHDAKELTKRSMEGLGGFSSCEVASTSLFPNSQS